jgi:hypothetical protein
MPADRLFHRRAGHSRKVNSLTDFEFRVWWAYIMAADDFGILRHSHVELQSMCDALAMKKPAVVTRALEHIVKVGLVQTFMHQDQPYIYQADWQDWQRVKWPTKTINPPPPLDTLSPDTQLLFQVFPGGQQVPKKFRGSTSEVPKENFDGSFPRQQTLTANANADANGSRLTANRDVDFWAFKTAYPSHRSNAGQSERLYSDAIDSGKVTHAQIMEALENHKASAQWQEPAHVPNMQKWLEEQRWEMRLPPPKPTGTTSRTAGNAAALRRFVERYERQ